MKLTIALVEEQSDAESAVAGTFEAGGTWTVLRCAPPDAPLRGAQIALHVVHVGNAADLCSLLRRRSYTGPILVVSEGTSIEASVAVLEAGADDYLAEPFASAELIARARALIRRASGTFEAVAPIRVAGTTLHLGPQCISLTPTEARVLEVLLRTPNDVVSRVELLRDAFNLTFSPGTNVVDVHISKIRRKLEGTGLRIEKARGTGYRLAGIDSLTCAS